MKSFELEIEAGLVTSIYSDELIKDLTNTGDLTILEIDRASNVEWEAGFGGWVISSALNDDWYVCINFLGEYEVSAESDNIAVFFSREEALEVEKKLFWDLIGRGSV